MTIPASPLSVTSVGEVHLVQMPKSLDVAEAPQFRKSFQSWLDSHQSVKTVILDFYKTTVLDSSGIGALVSCYRSVQSRHSEFLIWGLTPPVKFVLSLAGLEDILGIDSKTDAIQPSQVLGDEPPPLEIHPSVFSRAKRLLDIVGALAGLGITALLYVPLAIAIKLDSPGPVLFSQTRCGLMGRSFRIWKFRSMVMNAESLKSTVENNVSGAFFKNENDPRITRIGRFIRKTSLDEFPQFWNVLRGEMSLVGTRPPTPDEIEQYKIPNWQRLNIKPGITGEWQVNGRSKVQEFETVIQMDLSYQENWSFQYDLNLLLKTLRVIFSRDSGAI